MWAPFVFGFQEAGDCAGRRGRWGWDAFGDWSGGQQRGRPHWHGRAARLFEQGDLKYVILRLLEEKPRHGYEIIKDLESRFGGSYAPSPGTVYPTLTMLEDLGTPASCLKREERRSTRSPTTGGKYLAEHSTTVNDIFERIARFVGGFTDAPMVD